MITGGYNSIFPWMWVKQCHKPTVITIFIGGTNHSQSWLVYGIVLPTLYIFTVDLHINNGGSFHSFFVCLEGNHVILPWYTQHSHYIHHDVTETGHLDARAWKPSQARKPREAASRALGRLWKRSWFLSKSHFFHVKNGHTLGCTL